MKKFLKIFFILFIIIIVTLSVAVFFFLKTFDINKYKPLISSEVKKELGRDIDFSSANLNVSLFQGLAIKLNDLQIDDSPAYQTDKLLRIEELSLGIDFLSYLLQRKLYISNIYVKSAQISIVKQKDGSLNLEDLAKSKRSTADIPDKPIKEPSHPAEKKPDEPETPLPQIIINSFVFKDLSIKYIDKSTEPPVNVEISKIDFKSLGFSPSHPSSFNLDAAVFSDSQNINCTGTLKLDLITKKITFQPLEITVDLSKLSFNKIKSSLPHLKNKPLPSTLKGKFYANIKKAGFTPDGLTDFNADLNFSDGKIVIEDVSKKTSLNVDKINFNLFNFSLNDESSYSFNMAFLNNSPNISSTGFIKPDLTAKKINLRDIKFATDLSSFSIEELKRSFPELSGHSLPSALNGQFKTTIKNAVLSSDGLTDFIADLNFSNGKIILENISKNTSLNIDKINFNIPNFSLDNEFSYSFSVAILNNSPNISSNGFISINLKEKEYTLRNTKFATDLSSFSIEELKRSFPELKDTNLPDELKGSIEAVISNLTLNENGLMSMQAEGGLSQGKIAISDNLLKPIENIDANFTMNETTFNFNNLSMNIGQGKISGSAKIDNYLTQRRFIAVLNLDSLDFSELINQTAQSVKLEGKITGSLNLAGEGIDKEQILNSISGTGNLSITEGKLTDINILKIVLGQLTMFPNLTEILETGLPEKYKEKLAQKDTILTQADIKAFFNNRQISLTPVSVYADNFIFQGKGDASFDKKYILKGSFYVPQNISLRMVNRVKELDYLLDEQNRLFIPLQVHGKGTDFKFIIDLNYLSKKVIRTQGREELKKVIYKTLKKDNDEKNKETESPSNTENQSDTVNDNELSSPEKPEKSIEEIIIDKVLDKFLKLEDY